MRLGIALLALSVAFLGDAAAPSAGHVDVLERRTLGAFDVAVLRADDDGALVGWLRENRYTVPRAADAILDRIVDRPGLGGRGAGDTARRSALPQEVKKPR